MISKLISFFSNTFKKSRNIEKVDESVDYSELPEELKKLIPFIDKLAIGDDVIREEVLESLTEEEVNNFINIMAPLINLVDTYLDSFGDEPLSDAAILIGNLGELYAEIVNNK
jgi:hypothetical protein